LNEKGRRLSGGLFFVFLSSAGVPAGILRLQIPPKATLTLGLHHKNNSMYLASRSADEYGTGLLSRA
jgi:hypothetical protein